MATNIVNFNEGFPAIRSTAILHTEGLTTEWAPPGQSQSFKTERTYDGGLTTPALDQITLSTISSFPILNGASFPWRLVVEGSSNFSYTVTAFNPYSSDTPVTVISGSGNIDTSGTANINFTNKPDIIASNLSINLAVDTGSSTRLTGTIKLYIGNITIDYDLNGPNWKPNDGVSIGVPLYIVDADGNQVDPNTISLSDLKLDVYRGVDFTVTKMEGLPYYTVTGTPPLETTFDLSAHSSNFIIYPSPSLYPLALFTSVTKGECPIRLYPYPDYTVMVKATASFEYNGAPRNVELKAIAAPVTRSISSTSVYADITFSGSGELDTPQANFLFFVDGTVLCGGDMPAPTPSPSALVNLGAGPARVRLYDRTRLSWRTVQQGPCLTSQELTDDALVCELIDTSPIGSITSGEAGRVDGLYYYPSSEFFNHEIIGTENYAWVVDFPVYMTTRNEAGQLVGAQIMRIRGAIGLNG